MIELMLNAFWSVFWVAGVFFYLITFATAVGLTAKWVEDQPWPWYVKVIPPSLVTFSFLYVAALAFEVFKYVSP